MTHSSRLQQFFLAALLVTSATLWTYHGILNNGFVSYDDLKYLFENAPVRAGLSLGGLRWALTATYDSNWFPLTWLSHMADVSMFGLNPRGHHLVSLVLHTINALLLLWILFRSSGHVWRSTLCALLFALHPMHVESVAWVAERKDVLSTLFFMLTIAVYLEHARKPTRLRYISTILLYTLGLASKPMLVSLPLILMLLDYWPLNRIACAGPGYHHVTPRSFRDLFREKLLFIVLAAFSCIITYTVQKNGASVNSLAVSPLSENLAHAMVNYVHYLYKAVRPGNLAVLYPYVQALPTWQAAGAAAMLALITTATVVQRAKRPFLLTGWLWFLLTLAPVIGIVSIGVHSIADRYTYIPLIGLSIMVVWGLAEYVPKQGPVRVAAALATLSVISALSLASRTQTGYWKDSITLYEHTLEVTSDNWVIHNNLAAVLLEGNQKQQALAHLQETIRIVPGHANAYFNLGTLYNSTGDIDQATHAFLRTIELNPVYAEAYFHLGINQFLSGERDAAYETQRTLNGIAPDRARALGDYLTFLNSRVQRR